MPSQVSTKPSSDTSSSKLQSRSINRVGLIALIVIFSFAILLTYWAVSGSNNSGNSSDDVTSPTGKILSPITGAVINSNIVPISVSADDDRSGVRSVEIFYKSKGVWEKLATIDEPPYQYNWDVSGLPIQSVTLDIHVTDNAGNVANTNSEGWQEDIVIIPSNLGTVN